VADPKKLTPVELGSLARAYTDRAILTLGGIMEKGLEEANRIRAADILLDRGWGRPKQDNTHELKGEVRVILRKMLEDEDGNGNGDAA
jgi:hypothetical protein